MEKAYIVTTGIYSDKSIQAVFSTREKAETFAEFHPGGDAEVVEFTADEIDPDKPEIRFTTVLMERNGELYEEPRTHIETGRLDRVRTNPRFIIRHETQIPPDTYPFVLEVTSHTGDGNAAVKRANEWRTQLESEELWPPQPPPEHMGNPHWGINNITTANRRLAGHLETGRAAG